MEHINNSPEQIIIRRSQNTLIAVGTGTILFSVWTVVRTIGMAIILKAETINGIKQYTSNLNTHFSDNTVFVMFIVMMILVMSVILGFRVYVGMAAISEGRGIRRRSIYLLAAFILLVLEMIGFMNNFTQSEPTENLGILSTDTSIAGLIITFTSVIMLTELIVSAFRIRKYSESWDHSVPRHLKKKL